MANRIKPLLQTYNDEKASQKAQLTVGIYNNASVQKTRPPVVGRETGVNIERDSRYSSRNDELKNYLKTLQQKTINRKSEVINDENLNFLSHSSDSTPSSENDKFKTKSTRFLKSHTSTVEQKLDVKITMKQESQSKLPFASGRISGALQRADAFTNKYSTKQEVWSNILAKENNNKDLSREVSVTTASPVIVDNVKDDGSLTENSIFINGSTPKEAVAHHVDESETESLKSLLNVKDLVDLASLSGHSLSEDEDVASEQIAVSEKETGESLNLDHTPFSSHVSGSRESLDLLIQKSDNEEENQTSKVSSEVTASKDYSDDFNKEITHSSSSSISTVKVEITGKRQTNVSNRNGETEKLQPQVTTVMKRFNAHKATQTSGVNGDRNLILINNLSTLNPSFSTYVDPCRISSVTVSEDILKGLSSYMPNVLALDEMMKQCLNGSRLFIESQRRSYISAIHTLKPTYQYTTWENTVRYLRKHRKKSSHKQ